MRGRKRPGSSILDLAPRSYSYLNRHWVLGRSGDRDLPLRVFRARLGDVQPAFDLRSRRRPMDAPQDVLRGDRGRSKATRSAPPTDGRARSIPRPARASSGRVNSLLDVAGERSAFLEPWKEPQQMTFGELQRYAAEIRGLGFPASRLRTALALRTALPFASLVMALLAVPFGFRMGRKGTPRWPGPGRDPGHGLLGASSRSAAAWESRGC
ncbi:MAG: LptF/LptG family permease [Anaerotruncus sp.]|nr:LptF/LptG family permease [Anaerotruncus sp.]